MLISLNTFSQEKIDSSVCKGDSMYFWYSPFQAQLISEDSLKEVFYFMGKEYTESSVPAHPNGQNKDYVLLGRGSWCDVSSKKDKLYGYHTRLRLYYIEDYFKHIEEQLNRKDKIKMIDL